MYIDTHLHIEKDVEDIVNRAKEANVDKMLVASTNRGDLEKNIKIVENFNNIFLCVGYHPEEVSNIKEEDLIFLEKVLKSKNRKIKAIGEIGLDYYWEKDKKEEQINLFKKHLSLAEKYNLPVVIHSREATKDTLDILKNYNVKGVFHCFNGSLETAQEIIKIGFYLGVGGVITFKNCNLKEVIKYIDLSHILLETDSPYMSPEPYRGRINEPMNIPIIAKYIADLKNVNINRVMTITTENAKELFDL